MNVPVLNESLGKDAERVCQHVGDPPEPVLGKHQVAIVFPANELGERALGLACFSRRGPPTASWGADTQVGPTEGGWGGSG